MTIAFLIPRKSRHCTILTLLSRRRFLDLEKKKESRVFSQLFPDVTSFSLNLMEDTLFETPSLECLAQTPVEIPMH